MSQKDAPKHPSFDKTLSITPSECQFMFYGKTGGVGEFNPFWHVRVKKIILKLSANPTISADDLCHKDLTYSCCLEICNNDGTPISDEQTETFTNYLNDKTNVYELNLISLNCGDYIEEEILKFKITYSKNRLPYVVIKSKTLGISEQRKTGTEWVERNSNTLKNDGQVDTFDYYFTPEYQVISLTLKDDPEEVISRHSWHKPSSDCDWAMYVSLESCKQILEELGFRPDRKQTLYVKELDRQKVKLNEDWGLPYDYKNPFERYELKGSRSINAQDCFQLEKSSITVISVEDR